MSSAPAVRPIAFYLPQFHPIPENDAWWGKGFTEWTNTAKALPLFRGHYQPHVPADLGFYDLRVAETRLAQADMARAYGIEAFCYYHYWFGGKRLLERSFNDVLTSGEPDFPYAQALPDFIPDPVPGIENYPCLIPNWDNTPRSGSDGYVLHGSTPDLFRVQVKRALDVAEKLPQERRIVFVKSWNEWAEGNHLEPDLRFGTAYLEALRDELHTHNPAQSSWQPAR